MQNPTPVPNPAAVPPVLPPLPAPPSLFAQEGPLRPLTPQEASIIREQRSEMSNQLTSATGRREELLNQLRTAPPGTEQGLRDQYQVLSNRIVAIENDIEGSGRVLRTGQIPAGMTIVPPRSFAPPSPADNAERGGLVAATVLLPIGAIYMWRAFRRKRRGGRREVEVNAEHDSRFERLEQAVDAIALEIERVGESQRYQAKLLAEANVMPAMSVGQKEPVRARDFDR